MMFNGRVIKGRIALAFGTLISTTSLSANDSVTFTISGYMPARCEIESVSRFLSDNRITLVANRYCNVPHRFAVDLGPASTAAGDIVTTVNGRTNFNDRAIFTDDRAIVIVNVATLSQEQQQEVLQSLSVTFET